MPRLGFPGVISPIIYKSDNHRVNCVEFDAKIKNYFFQHADLILTVAVKICFSQCNYLPRYHIHRTHSFYCISSKYYFYRISLK